MSYTEAVGLIKDFSHDKILFAVLVGSHGQGLNGPDSDYDIKAVLYPTVEELYSGELLTEVYTEKGSDVSYFTFGKFMELLEKGNQTAFEMMGSNKVLISNEYSDFFVNNASEWVTIKSLMGSLAFCKKQLSRIKNRVSKTEEVKKFNVFGVIQNIIDNNDLYHSSSFDDSLLIPLLPYRDDSYYNYSGVYLCNDRDYTYLTNMGYKVIMASSLVIRSGNLSYSDSYLNNGVTDIGAVELGDLQMLVNGMFKPNTLSSLMVEISHTYKNYLKTVGTRFSNREDGDRVGRFTVHILRELSLLQRTLDTGYYELQVPRDAWEGLMLVKQAGTLKDIEDILTDTFIIDLDENIQLIESKIRSKEAAFKFSKDMFQDDMVAKFNLAKTNITKYVLGV